MRSPSALDGVPFGQPALALAAQLQRRAARAGVPEELARLDGQPEPGAPGPDLGRELFRLVAGHASWASTRRRSYGPPPAATATWCTPGSDRARPGTAKSALLRYVLGGLTC